MSKCMIVLLVAAAGVAAFAGCKSTPPPPEPPKVAPVEAPAAVALAERVVFRYPDPAPAWAFAGMSAYPDKKATAIYFMGIGLPNEYEQKARQSARTNASEEISSYLSNSVNTNEYYADELQNSKGYVPIQSLVRKTVGKHVSEALLRGQYETAIYIERIERMENRVPQLFFKVKAVYEYPLDSIKKGIAEAKRDFEEQAKALDIKERDEVKKKLIERSSAMLDAMANQDFGTTVPK